MNKDFLNDVQKTIIKLNNRDIDFGSGYSKNQLSIKPLFKDKKGAYIESDQLEHFGFYSLRNAFRGILLSINYIASGDLSLKSKLWGPAVSNYYTGMYHLHEAFSALNGRVFCEETSLSDYKEAQKSNQFVIASFTSNQWHLKRVQRNHKNRWLDIIEIRPPNYSESYLNLFKYWYRNTVKEKISPVEYLNRWVRGESLGTPVEITDFVNEFFIRITDARQEAVYRSFGSDPIVVTNLINRDSFSDTGIDLQAVTFKNFCYEMLKECTENLIQILNSISTFKRTREYIWTSICNPWFDEPQTNNIEDEILVQKLQSLIVWVLSTRQKRIKFVPSST